ncbi:hypothetical protein Aph01nite_05510 [Acrocarpospora phusangensis]|uniref:Uncharacterized protein n=1 Tax=Acrocarpospora phusangensis TaxID=1070424 RepID=A0A919Q4Z4_9ACTN|nr:hypothetical protein Aph01nite_05510 [Acrocarpospora phusangensis]
MFRRLATPVSILAIISSVNGILAGGGGVSAQPAPPYGECCTDHDDGFSWG